jgi:hypothetical protein
MPYLLRKSLALSGVSDVAVQYKRPLPTPSHVHKADFVERKTSEFSVILTEETHVIW